MSNDCRTITESAFEWLEHVAECLTEVNCNVGLPDNSQLWWREMEICMEAISQSWSVRETCLPQVIDYVRISPSHISDNYRKYLI